MKNVTFTSDFGLTDPYVAEVKGVIKACSPDAWIIDLSHGIEAGNLLQASFILSSSYRYFIEGTVHLAVIDPGVGTARDIIAVQTAHYSFVGPDNGVLRRAASGDGIRAIYALDRQRFLRSLGEHFRGNPVIAHILETGISSTFHGRDLFAPLVGYILEGFALEAVGEQRESIEKLVLAEPVQQGDVLSGKIIHIDRFGNLITNVRGELIGKDDEVFIRMGEEMVSVGKCVSTFSDVSPGTPAALIGSRNSLEIAVNSGSARDYFGAFCGDEILIMKREPSR